MFPAQLYSTIFFQGMLAFVLLTAAIYQQGRSKETMCLGYNAFMIWALGGVLILFIGTRPLDPVFIDMGTYAASFTQAQNTGRELFASDWAFSWFTSVCAETTTQEVYFLLCTVLYIVPLMMAARKTHNQWAFVAFLALASGFSFLTYGVNGIRNGISTSLLIAAFAYSRQKLPMFALMALAAGMHKSALIPIVAFLIAGIFPHLGLCTAVWIFAFFLSLFVGEGISARLTAILPTGEEERLTKYVAGAGMGGDRGGFRLDFVLYSIVPLAISWALASAAVRRDAFYRRLVATYLIANTFWILAMYAAFSNRFAYLSWFMLPWVIIYPFIPRVPTAENPTRELEMPRLSLLGAALVAHYAFTYVMFVFIYRRGE